LRWPGRTRYNLEGLPLAPLPSACNISGLLNEDPGKNIKRHEESVIPGMGDEASGRLMDISSQEPLEKPDRHGFWGLAAGMLT
jgi:hypothetical protein